jgi:hypothetical protein
VNDFGPKKNQKKFQLRVFQRKKEKREKTNNRRKLMKNTKKRKLLLNAEELVYLFMAQVSLRVKRWSGSPAKAQLTNY